MRCECGAGLQKRIVRTRSVVRGESTTIYASSKLNRAGRRAARYDSGLKAHRYNQPARKRPAPHRIAPGQVACSRSRCGNLTTLHLPLVNPHSQSLAEQPPLPRNHARYDLSGNVISEYGEGCGPTCWARGYVYFNGQRIAEYANSTTYFAHNDHLGSPRLFTDVTAAYATDCYDFLPFGERNLPTSPCSSPSPPAPPPVNTSHLFTGKERDSESGLDNFEARYFGSSLGRFMSADPENLSGLINQDDPQAWNGYAYVRNNPLVYTDPSGANYTVCDTNGKNCADLTDKQFNQYLKDNPDVSKTASGDLYVGNTKVGSASYYNERDVAAAQFLSGPVQNVVTKAAYVVGGAMAGVYLWTAYTTYGVGTTALNLAGAGGAAAPILYKTGDIIEEVVPDSSGTG